MKFIVFFIRKILQNLPTEGHNNLEMHLEDMYVDARFGLQGQKL